MKIKDWFVNNSNNCLMAYFYSSLIFDGFRNVFPSPCILRHTSSQWLLSIRNTLPRGFLFHIGEKKIGSPLLLNIDYRVIPHIDFCEIFTRTLVMHYCYATSRMFLNVFLWHMSILSWRILSVLQLQLDQ